MSFLVALFLAQATLNPNQCSYENPQAACMWYTPLNEGVEPSSLDELLSKPEYIA